jgi:hypothetical protein
MRRLATRVGHDAVWLAIAGLFCVVEGAVKLTELSPPRFMRVRRASAAATLNRPAAPPARQAFAQ